MYILVPDYGPGTSQRRAGLTRRGLGVLDIAQPFGSPPADLGRLELRAKDVGREEVVLNEVPQAPADPVLPVGDDGCVRDGDVERMAEEGGDGKPIGDPADHGCLGGRPDVAEPGVSRLEQTGRHEDDRHQDQEAGRPPFHPVEVSLAFLGIGDRLHGGHVLKIRRTGGKAEGEAVRHGCHPERSEGGRRSMASDPIGDHRQHDFGPLASLRVTASLPTALLTPRP